MVTNSMGGKSLLLPEFQFPLSMNQRMAKAP